MKVPLLIAALAIAPLSAPLQAQTSTASGYQPGPRTIRALGSIYMRNGLDTISSLATDHPVATYIGAIVFVTAGALFFVRLSGEKARVMEEMERQAIPPF